MGKRLSNSDIFAFMLDFKRGDTNFALFQHISVTFLLSFGRSINKI